MASKSRECEDWAYRGAPRHAMTLASFGGTGGRRELFSKGGRVGLCGMERAHQPAPSAARGRLARARGVGFQSLPLRPLLGTRPGPGGSPRFPWPRRLDALAALGIGCRQQAGEAVAVRRLLRTVHRGPDTLKLAVDGVPVDFSGHGFRADAQLLRRRQSQRRSLRLDPPQARRRVVIGTLTTDDRQSSRALAVLGRGHGPRVLLTCRARVAIARLDENRLRIGDRRTAESGGTGPTRRSAGPATAGGPEQGRKRDQ